MAFNYSYTNEIMVVGVPSPQQLTMDIRQLVLGRLTLMTVISAVGCTMARLILASGMVRQVYSQ